MQKYTNLIDYCSNFAEIFLTKQKTTMEINKITIIGGIGKDGTKEKVERFELKMGDIGYYVSQAYEGIIKETKEDIKIGVRYWFLPRRCMLQWRHSGLVNAVTKLKDGSYKVRIEGLLIG